MSRDTIFDIKEKSKELEDLYNPSSSPIPPIQQTLINHFGASLHNRISGIMAKEIDRLKSPAAQTMMDIYHQSGAKSWSQFVNNSSLQYLRKNNQQTFSILQNYQSQFTQNIYAPLSQYISSPHNIFKGAADHLIQQISAIYNHLKLRKISPNCCMQIDLRCPLDIIACNTSNDEELEWNVDEDDIDYDEYKNASNTEQQQQHLEPIPAEMDTFNLISDGNIDQFMRQCVMPLDDDSYCYKRYEILLYGSEIKSFEAVSNNNIPRCAFENAPLCLIFNSTASAQQIFNELCTERVGLITVSFHVYNEGMSVYLYVNDDKGKLFGSRIFENDLASLIPLLFEDSNINKVIMNEINNYLQFKPDAVYKKYYMSLIKQVLNANKNDEAKKLSMEDMFEGKLDPLLVSKLEETVNSWNGHGDNKCIINTIKRCFIENNINYEYFEHHTRKDLMKLLKPYNIKAAAATKIWNALIAPRANISDNDDDENFMNDPIITNIMDHQQYLQRENEIHLETINLLKRQLSATNQENHDLKRVIENAMHHTAEHEDDEDGTFVSKLEETVNSLTAGGDKRVIDMNAIKRCFMENNVNYTYFEHHTKRDLIKLLKPYNIKAAAATKIWNAFVAPQSNLHKNINDAIHCELEKQQLKYTETLYLEKIELLEQKLIKMNEENEDLKYVIQNMIETDGTDNDESKQIEDEDLYTIIPRTSDISMNIPSMLFDNASFINPVAMPPPLSKIDTFLTHSVIDRGIHVSMQQSLYYYQQGIGYLYQWNMNNIYKRIREEASFVLCLLYFYMIREEAHHLVIHRV